MVTIAQTISRVRNDIKGVRTDAFITDRFLYSLILKWAKLFIKRQDERHKIAMIDSMYQWLCFDLIEVDKVEACCGRIKSECTIMRTKCKLPGMMEGSWGPLIRNISSVDGSDGMYKTFPATFVAITNSTNYKYNTTKYYWIVNGYAYFPNVDWETVRLEAMWDDDISYLLCDDTLCQLRQSQPTNIPDWLFAEIEQQVLQELGILVKMPPELSDDKQSLLRT